MSASFLATKLYIPPLRPELIPRPRLIRQLNVGMARKFTLVSAPAGYGKTTLLIEWIQQADQGRSPSFPVAWLSLDEGDNDRNRFLLYLIRAAQSIVPQVGDGLLAMLQSPQPPPAESVLGSLINELAATSKKRDQCCLFALVLDDYHLIHNPLIHEALTFLIDRLPPPPEGLHLVLATRKDPLLPLPRWRAGAQMAELREADLRFTRQEASRFLTQAMGLALSREQVAALESRTEGWISGLQLAALSMRGLDAAATDRFVASFTGADRHIVDYLVDEVLGHRPAGTKDFLLKTSILERMSGPLCDAVWPGDGGQQILEALDRANLFVVPLDNQRLWYRYHHLFADLLRHRLRAMVGPSELAELHLRASEWYERNGRVADAVHHAVASGDQVRTADLIEHNARDMLARSELKTLLEWVDALPEEAAHTRPWLCIFYAWALRLTGGQADAVDASLLTAEQALKATMADLSADQIALLRGHIAGIRAYQALYREQIPRVIDLARQALRSLPETTFARGLTALALGWALRFAGDLAGASQAFVDATAASLVAGNRYTAATASCRLAYTQMLAGQLQAAAASCQEALDLAVDPDGQRLPVAGYALVYLGMIEREWNDLEQAASHLEDGIDLCTQVGFVLDQLVGYATLARVRQATQDWDAAYRALESARQLSRQMQGYVLAQRWVEDCQVRLWSAQGRLSDLAAWVRDTDLGLDDEIRFVRELEHIILARALVALGREHPTEPALEDALELLSRLLSVADSAGWMGKVAEILILQALAHQARDRGSQALSCLDRALTVCEPERHMRLFLDEGPAMARLLTDAAVRGIAPHYVPGLLGAFSLARQEAGVLEMSTGLHLLAPWVDPLTEREREVLQLIAQGLSNREIADRLVLALSTVKVHTRNIYAKLDVNSRTQAVHTAQRLRLL